MKQLKVYKGQANCTACGKAHKTIYEIDGLPYGSSCASKLLNSKVSAPSWLYELAEEYARDEYEKTKESDYNWIGELSLEFFNLHGEKMVDRSGASKLWEKPIEIKGKKVKVDWQHEINLYIVKRYIEMSGKNINSFQDGAYYKEQWGL